MRYSFDAPDAPTTRQRQYYAMLGTRGIWENGWKAVTVHGPASGIGHFDEDAWQRAVEFLFGFTLASGLVVLFAAVTATREARSREFAVMRALGASGKLVDGGIVHRNQRDGEDHWHPRTAYRSVGGLV
jgi:hypothetical protein